MEGSTWPGMDRPKLSVSTRDRSLDALRGIAILLVVVGHAIPNETAVQVIFAFHMPLFMFVSGMTMALARSSVKNRARGLLLPYFAWTLLFGIVDGIWNPEVLARAMGVIALNPRAGLWFLPVLFFCALLLIALQRLPWDTRWLALGTAIVCILAPHPGGLEPYNVTQLAPLLNGPHSLADFSVGPGILGWRSVLWFLPFFLAGYLAEPYRKRISGSFVAFAAALACFAALVIMAWPVEPGIPLLRYAVGFAGIALTVSVAGWLRLAERPLAALGTATLGIYALHGRFLQWTFGRDSVRVVVSIVVATGLSYLLTRLIESNALTATLLLGKRWRPMEWPQAALAACTAAFAAVLLAAIYGVGPSRWAEVAFVLTLVGMLAVAKLAAQRT